MERAKHGCAGSKDCSSYSLQQDIRAADANEAMVWLTVWQFAAGLAGLYVVARTLQATESAVREANDATNAAKDALEITKDGTHRQLRAYVNVMTAGVDDFLPGKAPLFWVSLRNTGQTPALNLRNHRNLGFRFLPAPDIDGPHAEDPDDNPPRTLAAGGELTLDGILHFPLSQDFYAKTNAGELEFIFFGIVRYEDVFGETRTTNFRFVFGGKPNAPSNNIMHAAKSGNHST